MNEIDFYAYLRSKGIDKKMCSDFVSRIKRIEKSIQNCDIDEQYEKDKCAELLLLFKHKGENDKIKKMCIKELPIGNYTMNTFRYAIRKYISFRNNE